MLDDDLSCYFRFNPLRLGQIQGHPPIHKTWGARDAFRDSRLSPKWSTGVAFLCVFYTLGQPFRFCHFTLFWEAFAGTHMLSIGKLPGEGCDAVDLLRFCRYFTTQDLGSNGRFHDRE